MTVSLPSEESSVDVADVVFAQMRRLVPSGLDSRITLDSSLYEIGLDSLARMEALNGLEETFGMRFSEESLADMGTCRDVVEYIEANAARGGLGQPSPSQVEVLAGPPSAAVPGLGAVAGLSSSAESTVDQANCGAPAPAERRPAKGPPVPQGDVTQFPECLAFQSRLAGTAAAGLANPFFRCKERVHEATATIAGRETITYSSFDYLGLAGHPRVISAAKSALERFGASASASRLVGGNHAIVRQLDQELASFLGTEAAMVFPSGYGTNASIFGHLFGDEDLILYDELAHNSIVQGAQLSKAQRRPFPHNNFQFLDSLLRDVRAKYRRVVIALDGVYSMDGDFPNLPQFIEVKRRHQALLYVDEAHSVGVLGSTGRGLCEHFGIEPAEGDLWMGTISKALASGGGYLAGPEVLIQYLKYTTPAFVFATAVSPANAAAALEAVRIIQEEPDRVARLRERSHLFLKLAADSGLDTGTNGGTPAVPIILGESRRCLRVAAALLREGIDAQPILYPAVPESKSRIRFLVTANHTEEQICRTVEVLADSIAAAG
jgi:8-amino-7-oxononanoate synthase